MEHPYIRFETEQQDWAAREARISKKFGADFVKSRPHLKEKLAFLEGLEIRYGRGNNLDERLELAIHRQQRREIEKLLYPNLFMRLAYKVMQSFVINREQQAAIASQHINVDAIKNDLAAKGLGTAIKDFEQQARLGKQEFTIPVSYHVSENESMAFKIDFKKDLDGTYRIKDTVASLKVEGQPKAGGSLKMGNREGLEFNADNAYRLLSGKSLKKDDTWVNVDFNDRDANGHCCIRSFPKEYGFDVENLLRLVNAKELQEPAGFQRVRESLENGFVVELTPMDRGKAFMLEANPRQLSLKDPKEAIRESNGQQVKFADIQQQQKNRSKMKIG